MCGVREWEGRERGSKGREERELKRCKFAERKTHAQIYDIFKLGILTSSHVPPSTLLATSISPDSFK